MLTLEKLISTLESSTSRPFQTPTKLLLPNSSNPINVFIKTGTGGNSTPDATALTYEAKSLQHLFLAAKSFCPQLIHIPNVHYYSSKHIVIDYLQFSNTGKARKIAAEKLGRGLAMIHKGTAESNADKSGTTDDGVSGDKNVYKEKIRQETFGFEMDGFCGDNVQFNNSEGKRLDWVQFWRDFRLNKQLEALQAKSGFDRDLFRLGKQVSEQLGVWFEMLEEDHIGRSLIHGDLWSGNWGAIEVTSGKDEDTKEICATLFDPACYYGHNEADLGIAYMFGMPSEFFSSYFDVLPQQPGFKTRQKIYELHHHLNHCNIFGTGYQHGALKLLSQILND